MSRVVNRFAATFVAGACVGTAGVVFFGAACDEPLGPERLPDESVDPERGEGEVADRR